MSTTLICFITFIVTFIVFVISINMNLLTEIPIVAKFLLLVCSIIPAWGFVIAISGIIYLIIDAYKKFK